MLVDRKPCPIEAIQWTGENTEQVVQFVRGSISYSMGPEDVLNYRREVIEPDTSGVTPLRLTLDITGTVNQGKELHISGYLELNWWVFKNEVAFQIVSSQAFDARWQIVKE